MIQRQKGFIQLIIIIIMAVIILSLLGISISSLINNKTLKENFGFLIKGVVWLWNNYFYEQAVTMVHFVKSRF
jgi:hypothetical protein